MALIFYHTCCARHLFSHPPLDRNVEAAQAAGAVAAVDNVLRVLRDASRVTTESGSPIQVIQKATFLLAILS